MSKNKVLFWSIIIFTVASTARVALLLGILVRNPEGFMLGDAPEYWQIAENVVYFGSFSQSISFPLIPDHSRTPLYPLFIGILRVFGLDVAGIILVQIILSSATCLIVILLTHKLIGKWQPALLAGGIIALDIPSIVQSNLLLTETFFTFLFTLSIYYLVLYFKEHERILALLYSGILMGLSILCRPVVMFFPLFVVLIFYLLSKKDIIVKFRRILFYLVVCFMTVSPWLVRNQVIFGSPVLSTIGYHNILYWRAGGVYSIKEGVSLRKARELLNEIAKSTFQEDTEKEPIKYKEFEAKIGTRIILKHPDIFVRNHLLSVGNLFFSPMRSHLDLQLGLSEKGTSLITWGQSDSGSVLSRLFQKTSTFTIVVVVIQLLMLVIIWPSFILGIVMSFVKKEYMLFIILIVIIAYFCILSSGPESFARLRVPVVPFLALGSGVGLVTAYGRLKTRIRTTGEDKKIR